MTRCVILGFWVLIGLSACLAQEGTVLVTPSPEEIIRPTTAATFTPLPPTGTSIISTQLPISWQEREVIPVAISPRMLEVYRRGLELGNNPRAFSKIGDGNASADWFLADFDRGVGFYNLGGYESLQATIDFFHGSFSRRNLSAGRGFNTLILLDPSKADQQFCEAGETLLDCELRIHKPAFALILMGTNQVWRPDEFEQGMREILDTLIEHGVVPVLSTKADNLEGDGRINSIITALADEYEAPLWNFWAALQPLPAHGLQKDNEHITWAGNDFSNPLNMQSGWPWRNLTALQVLERLRNQVLLNEK
jgi:hypothetical protein